MLMSFEKFARSGLLFLAFALPAIGVGSILFANLATSSELTEREKMLRFGAGIIRQLRCFDSTIRCIGGWGVGDQCTTVTATEKSCRIQRNSQYCGYYAAFMNNCSGEQDNNCPDSAWIVCAQVGVNLAWRKAASQTAPGTNPCGIVRQCKP